MYWKQSLIKKFKSLSESGKSDKEISEELGVTLRAIDKLKNGIPNESLERKKIDWTEEKLNLLKNLINDDFKSTADIGRSLGISETSVRRKMKELNLIRKEKRNGDIRTSFYSHSSYTENQLREAVKKSYSISEVCGNLGLSKAGRNHATIKKLINELGIDSSHFTGRHKNKGIILNKNTKELKDILVNPSTYSSDSLKKRLIKEGLKTPFCENPDCPCHTNNIWCGKQVPLDLHHINGNHYDNRLENLQILCKNCHAQTDSFCRRKPVDDEDNCSKDV